MNKQSQFFQRGLILGIALIFFFLMQVANACSLVFWNNNKQAKVTARSMDLYTSDQPQLVVLPRGMNHDGMAGNNSIKWVSRYGSVVVTAFHTNAVSDGMNEAGLGAHLLYLHETQYGQRDLNKPGLANVLWIQYLLDNCKNVNEVVEASKKFQLVSIKVHGREWPLHVAVEDASGDSAVIEYIHGKMVIHHGPQYRVMTNEPAYDIQLANLKKYKLFGGDLAMPGDVDPMSRFVRASSYLKTLPQPKDARETNAGVLSVIRAVMVPFGAEDTSGNETEDAWATRWITMQDLTNKVYYFSSTTAPNIIWLEFKNLDFSSNAKPLLVDPANIGLVGEVSKSLTQYSQ